MKNSIKKEDLHFLLGEVSATLKEDTRWELEKDGTPKSSWVNDLYLTKLIDGFSDRAATQYAQGFRDGVDHAIAEIFEKIMTA